MDKKILIKKEKEEGSKTGKATMLSSPHLSNPFHPLPKSFKTWSLVPPYTERLARLAIRYVRSFTDAWAFLVNDSLANDDILAPSNASIRWKKAVRTGNPLLTLSDAVTRDEKEKNHVSV